MLNWIVGHWPFVFYVCGENFGFYVFPVVFTQNLKDSAERKQNLKRSTKQLLTRVYQVDIGKMVSYNSTFTDFINPYQPNKTSFLN